MELALNINIMVVDNRISLDTLDVEFYKNNNISATFYSTT